MPRFVLELAYKGTHYHGWQLQPNALGVQQLLNKALTVLFRQTVDTVGAGRTDTGVHASCFVAHFDLSESPAIGPDKAVFQLNALLPPDIVVYSFFPVNDDFHARFGAISRTYHYFITNKRTPFLSDYAHIVPVMPDVQRMNEACTLLLEVEDFSSFCKAHSDNKTTICRLKTCHWSAFDDYLVFTIEADRFLRNMVRALVGTLLGVGYGKLTLGQFKQIINARNRQEAGLSVPAKGLFLSGIRYPEYDFYHKPLNWPVF